MKVSQVRNQHNKQWNKSKRESALIEGDSFVTRGSKLRRKKCVCQESRQYSSALFYHMLLSGLDSISKV